MLTCAMPTTSCIEGTALLCVGVFQSREISSTEASRGDGDGSTCQDDYGNPIKYRVASELELEPESVYGIFRLDPDSGQVASADRGPAVRAVAAEMQAVSAADISKVIRVVRQQRSTLGEHGIAGLFGYANRWLFGYGPDSSSSSSSDAEDGDTNFTYYLNGEKVLRDVYFHSVESRFHREVPADSAVNTAVVADGGELARQGTVARTQQAAWKREVDNSDVMIFESEATLRFYAKLGKIIERLTHSLVTKAYAWGAVTGANIVVPTDSELDQLHWLRTDAVARAIVLANGDRLMLPHACATVENEMKHHVLPALGNAQFQRDCSPYFGASAIAADVTAALAEVARSSPEHADRFVSDLAIAILLDKEGSRPFQRDGGYCSARVKDAADARVAVDVHAIRQTMSAVGMCSDYKLDYHTRRMARDAKLANDRASAALKQVLLITAVVGTFVADKVFRLGIL